ADPASYMVIDMAFRQYFQWLYSAQRLKVNSKLARNSLIHLVNVMILEAAMRMGVVESDGTRQPIDVWVGEFVLDLRDELVEDLKMLTETKGSC
ncbi:MAG TPA: hypothetical protein VIE65_01500, partial [Methylobacter sp.]